MNELTDSRQRLYIPGPVDVPADALAAQTEPMVGHRSDEMDQLFARVQGQLRQAFCTRDRVYVLACSGTGLHEACIRNGVRAPEDGGRVLCLVNGAFGQRWYEVAVGCGKEVVKAELPWFQGFDAHQAAEAVRAALAQGPLDAVCLVHNETSTGVLAPLAPIAETLRRVAPDTLLFVDAVSSLGGAEIRVDDWRLDVCLTSSQKALAVPPGLALASVSDRVLERAARVKGRGWYFDFLNLEKYLVRSTTPATPAISLIRALEVQLERMLAEGLEARWQRHCALRDHTRTWADRRGFRPCVALGWASPTVSTLGNRPGNDVARMIAYAKRHALEISDGYGPQKGQSFRIGHLGETTLPDLDRLFAVLEDYLP